MCRSDRLLLLPMSRKSVENFGLGHFTGGSTASRLGFRRSRYQGGEGVYTSSGPFINLCVLV